MRRIHLSRPLMMIKKKKKITQKECHNQDETVKDEVIIL